jgi:rod shape-determining protein MreC
MRITPKIKINILVLLFAIFLLSLNFFSFPKEIRSFFYFTSQPIQNFFNKTGDSVFHFWETVFKIKSLEKDNESLRSNIINLLSENLELRDLEKENKELRDALNLEMEKDFEMTLVKIIGKDIDQDSIIINKGSEEGLLEGLVAVTAQKVLIGKISEVYDHYSRISLLSSKENSLDVQVKDKGIEGLIRGNGNLKLFLDLIPKDEEIQEGDIITTHYLSKKYPQGLLIGQIKIIKKQDTQPFQTADIESFFNIGMTETLLIINNF